MTLPDDFERVDRLFDEFVEQHRAGSDPDPAAFAQKAGDDAPGLLRMITAYLDAAAPYWPPEAAIQRLETAHAARRESANRPAAAPRGALVAMLRGWADAAAERAAELAAGAQREATGLTVLTTMRGALVERNSTVPLAHPSGGRAELATDGRVTVVLDSVPAPFIGLRPLVAFPRFRLAPPGFEWESGEQRLPEGIVQASAPIGPDGQLRVTMGRLGGERASLADLLSEIRVISEPEAGRDLVWESR